MTLQTDIPALASLEYIPYLENGAIREDLQGKIGVYAIFNAERELQYVGYSRDVYLSLKQHLIRQTDSCHWLKMQAIARPSRKVLAEIAESWIAENGKNPPGNDELNDTWTQAIDAKPNMTEEEKAQYQASDELQRTKILKKTARRVEGELKTKLSDRGMTMEIRFNPKLKEKGLLDLK